MGGQHAHDENPKKEAKADDKKEKAEEKKTETRELGDKIDQLNRHKSKSEEAYNALMLTLPNFAHESVPVGPDESFNKEVRTWGEIPKFDFLNFDRKAGKVSDFVTIQEGCD